MAVRRTEGSEENGARKPASRAHASAAAKPRRGRKKEADEEVIACIAHAMLEKKGGRVVSMDLREISGASFDFFVICEGTSGPQVRAVADEIEEKVYEQFGASALHVEGYANAEWILLDFGGIVAHVFLDSVRQHYRLEELWGDAPVHFYNDND